MAAVILQTRGPYQSVMLVATISKQDIAHLWATDGTEAIPPTSGFYGLRQDIIPEEKKTKPAVKMVWTKLWTHKVVLVADLRNVRR